MLKYKKKSPQTKISKLEDVENGNDESNGEDEDIHYDSMIENGTSEDSDEESNNASDNDDSDDGFSEHEEEPSPAPSFASKRKNAEIPPNGVAQKKHKVDKNSALYKQPTVEELNQLNETKNLFHSNLFRMQIQEILGEIKIKDKYTKFVDSWIKTFTKFLKELKSENSKNDSNQLNWLNKSQLILPLVLNRFQLKTFQFQFIKPTEDPFIVGSFKHRAMVGPKLTVDVCVSMPNECFQKDDYLSLVYDQKRALYLTYIANEMTRTETDNNFKYQFNYFNNNPLKPVLEVTPSGSIGKKLIVRIFVGAEEQSFKLNRFVPWNSNIRGSIFGEKNTSDSLPFATPNYNCSILFDVTMRKNQIALEETLSSNKNLQEGLILLKIWLRQRNFDVGYSGFGSHIMSAYVVYLFKQRKLHTAMSSYQVARQVWNHLALSTWDEDKKGITLCNDFSAPNQPTLEQFSTYFDVVFVDVTGFCNICANLSVDVYRRVKGEAKRTVDILNNTKINSFPLIFMTSCPIYTQYDHILKISNPSSIVNMLKKHGCRSDRHNFAGFWFPQTLKMISNLLRKGLSDRIFHIVPIETAPSSWDLNTQPKDVEVNFRLGLILNPERAYEILDKGPQANEKTADEFRKFWGSKSELRRFQDGSITEACVWSASGESFAKKRLIVGRIVEHLLEHHFDLESSAINYIAGQLDTVYKLNRIFKVDKLEKDVNQELDAETTSLEVIKSFDDLGQKLRTLDELPLEITNIQGTSPVFRFCDPVPVLADGRYSKLGLASRTVCSGIIQLGVSGNWPSELSALRALKTAFYVKIAQALKEKHNYRTLIRFDGIFIFKDGYVFRVEISHAKEIALMKKEVNEKGLTHYKDTPESIALEKRYVLLPKLTSALHGLYKLHPSFGPTVMIAKRWLYSQLIDDGLWPDECTELLIASQYLKMGAQANTCQPQTGFYRFLSLLANTDWQTEMVVLQFNEELDDESVSELENKFINERDSFPPLMIVTSYDEKRYGIWSKEAPIIPVLARVKLLAKHALNLIEPIILTPSWVIKPHKLFTASKEGYDMLIRLKPDFVPNCMANEYPSGFSEWTLPNFRQFPSGQNFLKFAITDLREAFSEFCIFFYNPCGGRDIALIWKPDIFAEKEFKVGTMNGCCLAKDEKLVKCNKEALIEDMKIILKDMYLSIEEMNK
ncbi:nucleolar protein 6 [Episyrphus balteatus]|uniref:nucleolar protein 6 n=1 Tax=Episyrphus balteatus TaxID=286459 RepID=UPI00248565D6|nr:nucleolar protein 6 [Episyrphus balteatus]